MCNFFYNINQPFIPIAIICLMVLLKHHLVILGVYRNSNFVLFCVVYM
jgi:hypothetical protein